MTKEQRKLLSSQSHKQQKAYFKANSVTCEVCKTKEGRYVLPSLVLCCTTRANRCPGQPQMNDGCWFCGKSATSKTKLGFVCGSSMRGCQGYEDSLRQQGAKALQVHRHNDPEFARKIRESIETTCMEKYGVTNPHKAESVKEKAKQTTIARYGVGHHSRAPQVRKKTQETTLRKYGVKFCGQLTKRVQDGLMKSLGVTNPYQSEKVKAKIRQIMLSKYGVPNAMQSPELFKRNQDSCYKTKQYTLPSGRVVNHQGYENFAIEYLLKSFPEEELLFGNELSFPYTDPEGDDHVYYPDLGVRSKQTAIEVKSTYTLACALADGSLIQKMLAVQSHGWLPVVQVWDNYKLLETMLLDEINY